MVEDSPKYDPWVGAKRVQTSAGLQSTRFHVPPYRAKNENLRKFGATYRHGTMFALTQYLYQKEAIYGGGDPKNIIYELVQKGYKDLRAYKLPTFM